MTFLKFMGLIGLLSLCQAGLAQTTQPLKKGLVVDTLTCAQQPHHSYAYYLPSNYDPAKKWPIIYIFEPAARGALPVDSFRMAAEQYGYILVGSNNSRNGAWEMMFEAADYLFADVEQRFSVEVRRRYTSGFSGGSRMALAVAALTDKVAGVIACGAALPNNQAYCPTEKSNFAYYGLVGNRDMNFQEMYRLEDQLIDWQIPTRLRIFPAGHQWPSPTLLMEAVAWMDLQAMDRGGLETNAVFVEQQEQVLLRRIEDLKTREAWYDLARHYAYGLQDFGTEENTFKASLAALQSSDVYTEAVHEWEYLREQEWAQRRRLSDEIGRLEWQNGVKDSLHRVWKKNIGQLRQQIADAPRLQSQMADRILNLITAQCVEWGWDRMGRAEWDKAIQLFKLWTIIEPETAWAYYNLAKAQCLKGKKKAAIKSLGKALEYGLDVTMLSEDRTFDSIRTTKKYKKMLAKAK
ncbi:MAG: hypothetical protein AAF985_18450 [Bacteroidota bacterium]